MDLVAKQMKRYDFIIVGAGASGLSLACHLAASPLRDRSILLVEKSLREHANKTWAFWEKAGTPVPFSDIAFHSWRRLLVATPGRTLALGARPYVYKAIRSGDFYCYAHERLSAFANIDFLEGDAGAIEDGEGGARIRVGGDQYEGRWVFDSRFSLGSFHPDLRYCYLRMQIRGWEIETESPSFDPQIATFMDFRTPQPTRDVGGGVRFLYVLPSHGPHALVEHVACIPAAGKLMHEHEEEQALKNYIEGPLGVRGYAVVSQEQGINPMTDYPFPRRRSHHVMAIGIAGGMLKPSTGFAFARIQRDSAAIVSSLLEHGQPFDVPHSGWAYRLSEPLMLWAMARHGEIMGPLLGALFTVGRTRKILSFLDEKGMPV
jgi:lycopene beta-cyclase